MSFYIKVRTEKVGYTYYEVNTKNPKHFIKMMNLKQKEDEEIGHILGDRFLSYLQRYTHEIDYVDSEYSEDFVNFEVVNKDEVEMECEVCLK